QAAIELRGITLHVHQRPRGGEGRHVAGRMPGGAGGELVLFQEHAIRPSRFRQMIERRAAHGAAASDDNACPCRKISHFLPSWTSSIDWWRDHPDHDRRFQTRITPAKRLLFETKTVAWSEPVPHTIDFNLKSAR